MKRSGLVNALTRGRNYYVFIENSKSLFGANGFYCTQEGAERVIERAKNDDSIRECIVLRVTPVYDKTGGQKMPE